MTKPSLQRIASHAAEFFGNEKRDAILAMEWLKSAIDKWSHTASITSFAPYDADFASDRPINDLFDDFLADLIDPPLFDDVSSVVLICSSLADALGKLTDENQVWAEGKSKDNVSHFEAASHLSATVFMIFGALQRLDSERAMRWAALSLKEDAGSKGFLSWTTQPFPIRIFNAVDRKVASTVARCEFFISLYEWAERNTTDSQVFARFPELLKCRLEAVHGTGMDLKYFDVLQSLLTPKNVQNLAPIQVIDGSLGNESELYDDDSVLTEFSDELSDLTSVHVARYIREMSANEKSKWMESTTLRLAFGAHINTPPVPNLAIAQQDESFSEGSVLEAILSGAAYA